MPKKRSDTSIPKLSKSGKITPVSTTAGVPQASLIRRDVAPLQPLFCKYNHPLVVAGGLSDWTETRYAKQLTCGVKTCPAYHTVVLCGEPHIICEYHRSNKKVNKENTCWCGSEFVEMTGEGEQTIESSMLSAITLGCPNGHQWHKVFLESVSS